MDRLHTVLKVLAARGLDVRSCRVRALRSYRARSILCFSLTCFDPDRGSLVRRNVIGKGYADVDGAATFEILRELWQAGFGADRRRTISEPMAYVPALGLLLQDRAPGKSLHRYLGHPARAIDEVRRTAEWLAKLHSMRVARAAALPLSYEEERVRRYGQVLGRLFPGFARRIERIAGRVTASLKALGAALCVPTHGDFQPKNIHACADRITVFDFDRFALAHPARDLGHFIGQSMTMSYERTGTFREIEPWNAAFLEEYARRARRDAASALPIFVSRTFLEVLHHKLFVYPVRDPSFLPTWLDECERWGRLG
jgi:hypothetical protein